VSRAIWAQGLFTLAQLESNSHGALGHGHVEVAEDHVGVLVGAVVFERVAHAHRVLPPVPRVAQTARRHVVHVVGAVGVLGRHQVRLSRRLHRALAKNKQKAQI